MQVSMLGPLEVTDGDTVVAVGGGRLRALLARLALDAGRVVTVDALVASLWDDDEPSDTTNALQSLVSRLRRILPGGVLESRPGGYVLDIAREDVDVVRFEEAARRGRDALRAGDAARAAGETRAALALWRGPAFTGLAQAPFTTAPAARLDELRLGALEDRIEADLALGAHLEVIPELEALVADHPLRERLALLQMTALTGAGRSAEALAAYERTRTALADELGVDPSIDLQDLHLAVLRGAVPAGAHADAVAPAPPRTNLRASLTSFVGRDAEIARIVALLDEHRLVTLVGPGGAGKTRLATQAAARSIDAMPVWIVELAPISDPSDIAQAVLSVLDLRERTVLDTSPLDAARDPFDRLVDALGAAPALLVLDNCEHLIAGAAQFADDLLARCPDLTVVATSREPLGITGETLCPVPSLATPPPDADAATALGYPAVALFTDRARAVDPGFVLDDGNVRAVVEICTRLDGLPLAVELAAARLRGMSVGQLATRIDDRFRLLTGGSRTAVARHRTLRAVVEWSWELLDDRERRLVELLAVFPAGASADAVHAVDAHCGAVVGGVVEDVEELLLDLADKSLVQVEDGVAVIGNGAGAAGAALRFRMLETIREYGVDRLAEHGDPDVVRAAHARHFRSFAEIADPHLRASEQLAWFDLVEQERDNLLGAVRFAAASEDADTALGIVSSLALYWIARGSYAEAGTWSELALEIDAPGPPEARVVATAIFAMCTWVAQRDPGENRTLRRHLDAMPEIDPLAGHPLLALIGPVTVALGSDVATGEAIIDANLAHPDPWTRGALHVLRGRFAENEGLLVEQGATFTAALDLFREVGDRWGMGMAQAALGEIHELEGDLDGARTAFEIALALAKQIRANDDVCELLVRLAFVDTRAGELDAALTRLADAHLVAETNGSPFRLAFMDATLATVHLERGDLETARACAGYARERYDHGMVGLVQVLAVIETVDAAIDIAEGNVATAHAHLARARELAVPEADMPVLAHVTVGVAELLRAYGRGDDAAVLLGAATSLRGTPDATNPAVRRVTTGLRADLGDAFDRAYDQGVASDRAAALELLAAALEREGATADARQALRR